MKTKFMSVSMSLLIAGFTLCACSEGLGGVGDNPITPEQPGEPETPEEPAEIKGILSEINIVDEGGMKEILTLSYDADGKLTGTSIGREFPDGQKEEGVMCTYTYDTDKITVERTDGDDVDSRWYELKDGVVTKFVKGDDYDEFTYKDGKLVKFTNWEKDDDVLGTDDIYEFTWNDKALASYEKYELNDEGEKEDVSKYTVTYGTTKAGALAGLFFFGDGAFELSLYLEDICENAPIFDKLGTLPEFLPEKLVRTWSDEGEEQTRTYTAKYTIGTNNLVTKVVIKEDDNEKTYNLVWK